MKLSVNKAKCLWARNCATIQQVLFLKFAFGPRKFPGLSRNEPLVFYWWLYNKYIYYINTNEIPGELSPKNLISSQHVIFTLF